MSPAPPPMTSTALPPQSHRVTEDTPPDLLVGTVDLPVVLPSQKKAVRVTVARNTPMMDLLVQVSTAHRLSPGSHVLQVVREGCTDPIHYKPSSPIGALDASYVLVVPKTQVHDVLKARPAKKKAPAPQPFETTFRLQVLLPRNQLAVLRVSPRATIGDILSQICRDKGFDELKYELRHPVRLDERLSGDVRVGELSLQEVALVAKHSRHVAALSAADLPAFRRSSSGTASGVGVGSASGGRLCHHNAAPSSAGESSASSDSLGNNSAGSSCGGCSPPPPPALNLAAPRVPPRVKKRQAPAPPPQPPTSTAPANNDSNKNVASTSSARSPQPTHSRHSSDSSGYHEASLLSESPVSQGARPDSPSSSLPRKVPQESEATTVKLQDQPHAPPRQGARSGLSIASSASSLSLTSTGKSSKKSRAPPPPPAKSITPVASVSSECEEDASAPPSSSVSLSPEPAEINGSLSPAGNDYTPRVPKERTVCMPDNTPPPVPKERTNIPVAMPRKRFFLRNGAGSFLSRQDALSETSLSSLSIRLNDFSVEESDDFADTNWALFENKDATNNSGDNVSDDRETQEQTEVFSDESAFSETEQEQQPSNKTMVDVIDRAFADVGSADDQTVVSSSPEVPDEVDEVPSKTESESGSVRSSNRDVLEDQRHQAAAAAAAIETSIAESFKILQQAAVETVEAVEELPAPPPPSEFRDEDDQEILWPDLDKRRAEAQQLAMSLVYEEPPVEAVTHEMKEMSIQADAATPCEDDVVMYPSSDLDNRRREDEQELAMPVLYEEPVQDEVKPETKDMCIQADLPPISNFTMGTYTQETRPGSLSRGTSSSTEGLWWGSATLPRPYASSNVGSSTLERADSLNRPPTGKFNRLRELREGGGAAMRKTCSAMDLSLTDTPAKSSKEDEKKEDMQDELVRLQLEFAQWQKQLAENQSVLSATSLPVIEDAEPPSKPAEPEVEVEERPEPVAKPIKSFVPFTPPSIQFSSWGERPRRQVSVKADRDYVMGQIQLNNSKKASEVDQVKDEVVIVRRREIQRQEEVKSENSEDVIITNKLRPVSLGSVPPKVNFSIAPMVAPKPKSAVLNGTGIQQRRQGANSTAPIVRVSWASGDAAKLYASKTPATPTVVAAVRKTPPPMKELPAESAPPPPPMPTMAVSSRRSATLPASYGGNTFHMQQQQRHPRQREASDPREELMLAIRSYGTCGGPQLRKTGALLK